MSLKRRIIFLSWINLLLIFFSLPCLGSNLDQLLRKYQIQIEQKKIAIKQISKQEKKIIKSLTQIDNQISLLKTQLDAQQKELKKIQEKILHLKNSYNKTLQKQAQLAKKIQVLINNFLPIYLQSQQLSIFDTKKEVDWHLQKQILNNLLQKIHTSYQNYQTTYLQVQNKIKELKELSQAKQRQVTTIKQTQQRLVKQKLSFFQQVQKIRFLKIKTKNSLEFLFKTIKQLKHQQKNIKKNFAQAKGKLIWPVQGRVKIKFNLHTNPPSRGIGLACSKHAPVRAVFWGKVVHNDILRGFGKVVIIAHGKNYYSLYAFLANTRITLGQNVEQGEIIGQAGFYPKLKDYGLYFELRFGSKPINPLLWLTKF